MDWGLFWTIVWQVVLFCLLTCLPIAAFLAILGAAMHEWPNHILARRVK